MKNKRILSTKLFTYFVAAFLLSFFSFGIYTLWSGGFSLAEEDGWDGVTVATGFEKGNGTVDNPYVIQDASEFLFFKQSLEGESFEAYYDKYYELGQNIDFNGHFITPIGVVVEEEERIFQGVLDGKGYSLTNFKIEEPIIVDEISYYSLFYKTRNAFITNLVVSNYQILMEEASDKDYMSPFMAISEVDEEKESHFQNIVLSDFYLDASKITSSDSIVSAFVTEKATDVVIDKISLKGEIHGNENISNIPFSSSYENISNIINSVSITSASFDSIQLENIDSVYHIVDNQFYLGDQVVSNDVVLELFNSSFTEGKYFSIEDGNIVVHEYEKVEKEVPTTSQSFSFSIQRAPNFSIHASGIEGKTVYINNLDSDYQYYMGLNFTRSYNNDTPSMDNKNTYTSNNLVQFQIIYHGDLDADRTGTISYVAGEDQNTIVYYDYYAVNGSTIDLELIDNPFSGRPDDMAFNGWFSKDSDVTLYLDPTYYVWHAVVPVSGETTKVVELYASWVEATVQSTSDNYNSVNYALESLNDAGMEQAHTSETRTRYIPYINDDRYYYTRVILQSGQSQAGYYNAGGNLVYGNCNPYYGGTCTVYDRVDAGSPYDEEETYYYSSGYNMRTVDPRATEDYEVVVEMYQNMTMANYYELVHINRNASQVGYVNNSGVSLSGNCNTNGGCDVYKKILYEGDSLINPDKTYYYLVTRDTNFVYLNTSSNRSNYNAWTEEKPFTLTSYYYRNTDYRNNAYYDLSNSYMRAYADTRVEFVRLYSSENGGSISGNLSTGTSSTGYIYANHHNLKIGRGITNRNGYRSATAITGASNSAGSSGGWWGGGSSTVTHSDTKYKMIVESGTYTYATSLSLRASYVAYNNPSVVAVYGNDYDRIRGNHTSLDILKTLYGSMTATVSCSSPSQVAVHQIIKSGHIGSSNATTDTTLGIYTTSNSSGVFGCLAALTVENGIVNNIYGGPGPTSSMQNYNAVNIYFKDGITDTIFGGGAYLTSYGNRIVQVTGGQVNYSLAGGSNGIGGSGSGNSLATLNGDTYVYVGGNAEIGDTSLSDTARKFDMEVGSVFGVANGKSGYTNVGSSDNSYVVINGGLIHGNVYGGANYGATASSKNTGTYETKVKILDGTIQKSVYAGGNNNGTGVANAATVNTDIQMNGGTVNGSIYGGSRSKGTIYGSSAITINGGTVDVDVYGGGEGGYSNNTDFGTYVRDNVSVTIQNGTIRGNVYGGSAYGTVNAANQTSNSSNSTTNVTVNNGVIAGSVFGGAKGSSSFTPRVVGDITVTVNGGSIGSVFGGFDASGQPSMGDVVYLNGGTIGNAFGGGNNANQSTTDIRLQGSTITGNLYGGSNLLGTVTTSNVSMTSGSVTDIYGGNNLDGQTITTNVSVTGGTINGDIYGGGNEASSTTSNVSIQNVTVHDVYGGGKKAGLTTSNVTTSNVTGGNVFGGSNISGDVSTTNVHINSSQFQSTYGGNNQGGVASNTNIDTTNSTITNVFGGGDNATSSESHVTIYNGTITNVFGGGNEAGLDTSNVTILGGTITNAFGGSNQSGDLDESNIFVGATNTGSSTDFPYVDVTYTKRAPGYYPNSNKPTYAEITATVYNPTDQNLEDWEVQLNIPSAEIFSNNSNSNITKSGNTYIINSVNRYYGNNTIAPGENYSFSFSVLSDEALANFDVTGTLTRPVPPSTSSSSSIHISNMYGGNNLGGVTASTNIEATDGVIDTIFGGGNEASVGSTTLSLSNVTSNMIYGGGNAAGVTGDVLLDLDSSTVHNHLFGGGNEGIVGGSTVVKVTDSHIEGNAYAGGNGSTAIVYQNSSITIDGSSEIGTDSSTAPQGGCVFGSGNAANTGLESVGTSEAVVNIVGAKVHGNVYGGAKMAIVYGATSTNIGTSVVNESGLTESDIIIDGTVFGGGESNENGSDTYDWTFISVANGIDVHIDGTNYTNHNHQFIISGSIFGSGNASSSSGESNIYIKNLGSMSHPNSGISIQRTNYLEIDSSCIELAGATDRTNEYSEIEYSFNMIDKLVIKNGTTLLLQHNANLLKEFYSGVDVNGTLTKATVTIDDDTKTVTKNVDNRIYMIPNQNLNVATVQDASAYGRVTGMTFFGMYNSYGSGNYRFGLYDPSYTYGSTGNASLAIVGGSYVVGLRLDNHDITKDGFYTNYLDEENYTDITTAYIDPSTIGKTGYRWVVGFDAITYEIELIASKYSSLGTTSLNMYHFDHGDTIFTVLGFDSSGLKEGLNLVDSTVVPRLADTEDEANSIYGLSMKSETQEWTSYDTTKFLSRNNGDFTGASEYLTDSRSTSPFMMFYLYHAKNITSHGSLGSVVITLQAAIPKNAIEYDIKFVTITVNLTSVNDAADNYDASITYDKRYEMPSASTVNITNKSQFSTYFSLTTFNNDVTKVYGNHNENFHVLVTNHPLPVDTMITMMDFSANARRPEYYYFKVTQSIYDDALQQLDQYNEITYPLSRFVKMDSTSSGNHYDDATNNLLYYNSTTHLVDEEFMFIFDFKECDVTGTHLNNTMLLELRNSEDRTVYGVLGLREALMVYNTYDSGSAVLSQTFTDVDSYLYYNVSDEFNYSTAILYEETAGREPVIDTNYESSKMGLNVVFIDKDGEQVSSSLLLGTSITIGTQQYFADGDGVFRIKLANKVSTLNRNFKLTPNSDLPAGQYTVRYTLFASDDGLHNSDINNSVTKDFVVNVVSADNSIVVDCEDEVKVVDGETGLNMLGTRINPYTVHYSSELSNPNFRVEVFKRGITTIDSTEYISVPFSQLFTNALPIARDNEVSISMDNLNEKVFNFQLQESLTSGTYRVVFKLYDSNQLIDEETKYVIVNKKTE